MELFKNISDRERRILLPAAVGAAILAVILFVDLPLYKAGAETARKAREEGNRLNSIISMGKEYISIKYELEEIKERAFKGEGASLAGLDSLVNRVGLKKKLLSLKPTTTPVSEGMKKIKAELSLEKAALSELSRLLTAIESDGHSIIVERISVKATYDDPSMFNAMLVLNTVEKD